MPMKGSPLMGWMTCGILRLGGVGEEEEVEEDEVEEGGVSDDDDDDR